MHCLGKTNSLSQKHIPLLSFGRNLTPTLRVTGCSLCLAEHNPCWVRKREPSGRSSLWLTLPTSDGDCCLSQNTRVPALGLAGPIPNKALQSLVAAAGVGCAGREWSLTSAGVMERALPKAEQPLGSTPHDRELAAQSQSWNQEMTLDG